MGCNTVSQRWQDLRFNTGNILYCILLATITSTKWKIDITTLFWYFWIPYFLLRLGFSLNIFPYSLKGTFNLVMLRNSVVLICILVFYEFWIKDSSRVQSILCRIPLDQEIKNNYNIVHISSEIKKTTQTGSIIWRAGSSLVKKNHWHTVT